MSLRDWDAPKRVGLMLIVTSITLAFIACLFVDVWLDSSIIRALSYAQITVLEYGCTDDYQRYRGVVSECENFKIPLKYFISVFGLVFLYGFSLFVGVHSWPFDERGQDFQGG